MLIKKQNRHLFTGIGEQHLDILLSKLKNKYKIEAELFQPVIPYRETIKAKVEVRGKYKKAIRWTWTVWRCTYVF